MLSNQVLQNIVNGFKSITKCDLTILDKNGKVLVSTEMDMFGKIINSISDFILSPAEGQILEGYNYFKVLDNNITGYVVAIKGEDAESHRMAQLLAFHIQNLIVAYKERYDRDNFLKNLLLDNFLLVDIYSRAKKLHIDNAVFRIVYLIEINDDNNINLVKIIKNMIFDRSKDFITSLDKRSVILIKELSHDYKKEEIENLATSINEFLSKELNSKVYISIGTVVDDLKKVSLSYKEARMALEVSQIFYPDNLIIDYNKLGVARLIYQLPISICKIFLNEALNGIKVSHLDEEIFMTVNKFFENNLNVSETSRQLYIHRNTLIYRLDKLEKITGLDLRNFDNAIIFKFTLMVSRYISYKEKYM